MQDISKIIKDHIIDLWAVRPEEYDANLSFEQLGADHIDVMALLLQLENDISLGDMTDDELDDLDTPAKLSDRIQRSNPLVSKRTTLWCSSRVK